MSLGQSLFCFNLRDIHFLCDSATRNGQRFWTIRGGYCLPFPLPYQSLGLDTAAVQDPCGHAVKCALTEGLDKDCQCENRTICQNLVSKSCDRSHWLFPYPSESALITPYAKLLYTRDRDWNNPVPDAMQFAGHVRCIGYQVISNSSAAFSLPSQIFFFLSKQLEALVCNGLYKGYRNHSSEHYHSTCWNDSKTFHGHRNQVSFRCETRCISAYRVRDGVQDCLTNEEDSRINSSCTRIQ